MGAEPHLRCTTLAAWGLIRATWRLPWRRWFTMTGTVRQRPRPDQDQWSHSLIRTCCCWLGPTIQLPFRILFSRNFLKGRRPVQRFWSSSGPLSRSLVKAWPVPIKPVQAVSRHWGGPRAGLTSASMGAQNRLTSPEIWIFHWLRAVTFLCRGPGLKFPPTPEHSLTQYFWVGRHSIQAIQSNSCLMPEYMQQLYVVSTRLRFLMFYWSINRSPWNLKILKLQSKQVLHALKAHKHYYP